MAKADDEYIKPAIPMGVVVSLWVVGALFHYFPVPFDSVPWWGVPWITTALVLGGCVWLIATSCVASLLEWIDTHWPGN